MTESSHTANDLRKIWQSWNGQGRSFRDELKRRQVEYLSWSRVSTFLRCRRCYYFDYVLKQEREKQAATVGIIFHEIAQYTYEARARGLESQIYESAMFVDLPEERKHEIRNAHEILKRERWSSENVLAVEEPLFLQLSQRLPPVFGIPDLLVRESPSAVLVVDHKTSRQFQDRGTGQLVLYGEMVRQTYGIDQVSGCFDEYRLVKRLERVRTPAFRRTRVATPREDLVPIVARWEEAWPEMQDMHLNGIERSADACWFCNGQTVPETGLKVSSQKRSHLLTVCPYDETATSLLSLGLKREQSLSLLARGMRTIADVARAAEKMDTEVRMLSPERKKMHRAIERRRAQEIPGKTVRLQVPKNLRPVRFDTLGLINRVIKPLEAYGCKTIGDLHGMRESDILDLHGMGSKMLELLVDRIEDIDCSVNQ